MLETKEEIKAWLDSMRVIDYTINDDLTVDVKRNTNINLINKGITELPIQFGRVGMINLSDNGLTTLKGFPRKAKSVIVNNNELTSLEYAPKEISDTLMCIGNKLTSLKNNIKSVNLEIFADFFPQFRHEYREQKDSYPHIRVSLKEVKEYYKKEDLYNKLNNALPKNSQNKKTKI